MIILYVRKITMPPVERSYVCFFCSNKYLMSNRKLPFGALRLGDFHFKSTVEFNRTASIPYGADVGTVNIKFPEIMIMNKI